MDLGLYFKPIEKIEFTKNTIGSVVDSFNTRFPDWQSSDIVFFTVHESRGSSVLNNDEIDNLSIRKNLYNFKWEGNLKIDLKPSFLRIFINSFPNVLSIVGKRPS